MKDLPSEWADVSNTIVSADHVFLLFDFDGTLAPIVSRPDLARLPKRTKSLLETLAQTQHYSIGIISGRALDDIKARIAISGIIYAANHGLEIDGPGLYFANPLAREHRPILDQIHQRLLHALGPVKGTLVEHKGLTLSVHYRLVDSDRAGEVKSILEAVLQEPSTRDRVRIIEGKKIYDVRPLVDWDKGQAILFLLDSYSKGKQERPEPLPIFLGDDTVDEDGFRAVNQRNGISIFVGEDYYSSAAHYFLRSPKEVEEFLSRLVNMRVENRRKR